MSITVVKVILTFTRMILLYVLRITVPDSYLLIVSSFIASVAIIPSGCWMRSTITRC